MDVVKEAVAVEEGGGVAEEVIPALIAAGKAAALGAASGAASFVVKKGLGAAMHREIKRRKATPATNSTNATIQTNSPSQQSEMPHSKTDI